MGICRRLIITHLETFIGFEVAKPEREFLTTKIKKKMTVHKNLNGKKFPKQVLSVKNDLKNLVGYVEFFGFGQNFCTIRVYKKGQFFYVLFWYNYRGEEVLSFQKNRDLIVAFNHLFKKMGVDEIPYGNGLLSPRTLCEHFKLLKCEDNLATIAYCGV